MFIVPTTTALGQSLAAIVAGMAAIVANHVAGLRAISSSLVPMLSLVTWRLGRIALRLDRLVLRWRAGTLPRPRPCPGAARPTPPPRDQPAAEATPRIPVTRIPVTRIPVTRINVPHGNAWLLRLVQPTAQYISHFERFLANPETQALVQAAPQAGRLLRPLCRMLAITPPPWLRLAQRPRAPRPTRPRPESPQPPPGAAAAPATPYRPLPPWVRRTVRAWKPRSS